MIWLGICSFFLFHLFAYIICALLLLQEVELMSTFCFTGELPTYPSPKPTLILTSHLGQNVGLGEG